MAKDDRIDVEAAFQYLEKELKTFYTLYDELKGNCKAQSVSLNKQAWVCQVSCHPPPQPPLVSSLIARQKLSQILTATLEHLACRISLVQY